MEYVLNDVLSQLDGVRARAMFGGYGLYRNEKIFGLIADEELYFKVGSLNLKDYKKAGSEPFRYPTKKGVITMNTYWKLPASVMEDPAQAAHWAEKSCRIVNNVRR